MPILPSIYIDFTQVKEWKMVKTMEKTLTNNNFRVVFQGKIVEGAEASDVMQRMGILLNKDVSELHKLFSGSKIILKKNASSETCKRIRKKLLEAGAECLVEKEPVLLTNTSLSIDAFLKRSATQSDPETHQRDTELHGKQKKFTKDCKKAFLPKTTQRIHFVIASLYAIITIFLCWKYKIDPVSPFGHLLTTYLLAGGIGWISWRIARKSDLVANLVFNLSFVFFLIALLVPLALKNFQGQLNEEKNETNYSLICT